MGCDVCIGTTDPFDNVYLHKPVTARKPHRCCECKSEILPGQQYEREVCIEDGISVYKTCAACYEIRSVYSCGKSFYLECLWEDFEYAFEGFKMAGECWDSLTAPAKAKLLDKWREWKGLTK